MSWNDRVTGVPETLAGLIERIGSGYLLAEAGLALVVITLAVVAPRLGGHFYERVERAGTAFMGGPTRQILLVGLLALLLRAALLPWQGAPPPTIHDEQSLWLQAQTYLAGRLANPTHPFWEHFETFHVNQVPAYASMYFPGRSAPLVLGYLVADHPWVGIWLVFILMSMATVWMLQAWVPAPYAFLGGVLVVLRFGVFSYWINSYWGGAFTALGAMLVIGALPRILRQAGWGLGAVMGLGMLILMTTRAYEGMLLCVPVAVVLVARWLRGAPAWIGGRWAGMKVALPALAFVVGGGVLLLTYNVATTGQALKSPYDLNRATYADAPAFMINKPLVSQQRGPAYFRDFYRAEGQDYLRRTSAKKLAGSVAGKVFHNWNFYAGPLFTFALLAGLWASRRDAFLLGALAFFIAGYVLETWNFPHYTAPAMPLLLIVLMRGFQWLRGWQWRGRPTGLFLSRAVPTAAAAALLLPSSSAVLGTPYIKSNLSSHACCAIHRGDDVRTALIAKLQALPGNDLVLIKDGDANPLHYELVYNAPDIDRAAIVWARQLGPERDAALVKHLSERRVWEFEWRPDLPELYTLRPRGEDAGAVAVTRR